MSEPVPQAREANTPHVLDIVSISYAAFVSATLLVFAVLLCYRRRVRQLQTRSPLLLSLMAVGGVVHIVAETVTNQHTPRLSSIERMSCVLWGYWLPYVFGAGLFFTALYLRLFLYTAGVSVWCSTVQGVAKARRSRILIVFVTIGPMVAIAALATTTPGATGVSPVTGQCESDLTFKGCVAVWFVVCIVVLMGSVIVFRSSFARDVAHEARKQCLVSLMGVVVAGTMAFVLVFAETGLDDPINRALATCSAVTLYVWSLGVMAAKPLWRAMRNGPAGGRSDSFDPLMRHALSTMEQPVTTVRYVLENATDASVARKLFADFLVYCASNVRPSNVHGGDDDGGDESNAMPPEPLYSQPAAACYAQMDYWTTRKLDDLVTVDDEDAEVEERTRGFPPLVSEDLVRSDVDITNKYFDLTYVAHEDIGLDDRAKATLLDTIRGTAGPDKFRDAMWAVIDVLDRGFGAHYLTHDIYARDVYMDVDGGAVGNMIVMMKRAKAREHLREAELILDVDGDAWERVAPPFNRKPPEVPQASDESGDDVELDAVEDSSS